MTHPPSQEKGALLSGCTVPFGYVYHSLHVLTVHGTSCLLTRSNTSVLPGGAATPSLPFTAGLRAEALNVSPQRRVLRKERGGGGGSNAEPT